MLRWICLYMLKSRALLDVKTFNLLEMKKRSKSLKTQSILKISQHFRHKNTTEDSCTILLGMYDRDGHANK